jgi:hypothetical protein
VLRKRSSQSVEAAVSPPVKQQRRSQEREPRTPQPVSRVSDKDSGVYEFDVRLEQSPEETRGGGKRRRLSLGSSGARVAPTTATTAAAAGAVDHPTRLRDPFTFDDLI